MIPTNHASLAQLMCVAGMIAGLPLAATPAHAQPLAVANVAYHQATVPVPPPEVQTILVQSTLGALNQANLTNDYSVFLKLASSGFQALNTQGQLSSSFAGFREANIDLAALVLYPISWTASPSVEQGALRLTGVVPSEPQATTFDLVYVIENDRWRVAAVTVGLENPRSGYNS